MHRRLMLTVDVEALPRRAKTDHVNRLIWGHTDDQELGIGLMMDIAERHGAQLTAFLEFAEYERYGDDLLEAGRRIHARGHDVQLHLHQHVFNHAWHKTRGVEQAAELDEIDDRTAEAYLDYICPLHEAITGEPAIAYRGGAYRYNGAMLRALKRRGVVFASNYNLAAKSGQILDIGPTAQFVWENGLLELPIATLPRFRSSSTMHLNFNIAAFQEATPAEAAERLLEFLDSYYARHGDGAIAVFVLHSWSFLKLDEEGCFTLPIPDAPERFDAMLAALQDKVQIVTAKDVARQALHHRVAVDQVVGLPDAPDRPVTVEPVATAPLVSGPRCPICETPTAQFKEYNGGKRSCPGCGSVERQRVLADVYDAFIKAEHDFAKGETLIVAPMNSEKLFLRKAGAKSFKTMDVRPELKPDYQVNVCAMPSVPSESFDAVIASFVLTCVYDIEAALDEFHRILKPGGRLFTCDPIRFGRPTNEITDVEKITAWYGRENYETYRVGNYRNLGDLDLLAALQQRFLVKTFYGVDEGSGLKTVWHMSTKPGGPSNRRAFTPLERVKSLVGGLKAKVTARA